MLCRCVELPQRARAHAAHTSVLLQLRMTIDGATDEVKQFASDIEWLGKRALLRACGER